MIHRIFRMILDAFVDGAVALIDRVAEYAPRKPSPTPPSTANGAPTPPLPSVPRNRVRTVRRQPIHACIGLDFGTSFTKIVVRDLDTDIPYPIEFTEWAPASNRFLLPSDVALQNDSYTLVAFHKLQITPERNLKLDYRDSNTELEAAAAYLALALRHTRASFTARRKTRGIRWELNIGVPSNSVEHDSAERFRHLAAIAWRLSFIRGSITRSHVHRAISTSSDHIPRHVDIATYPEVFAAIATYTRSAKRRERIHILIDIGGGTVDIASFNLARVDGEDKLPLLSARVVDFGTHFLARHSSISTAGLSSTEFEERLKTVSNPPFVNLLATEVLECLKETRLKAGPSPAFQEEIPLFLAGGGAAIPTYNAHLVDEVVSRRGIEWNRIKEYSLPSITLGATAKDSLSYHEAHRLNTALGLSYRRADLGDVIPESKVGVLPRRVKRPAEEPLWKRNFFEQV